METALYLCTPDNYSYSEDTMISVLHMQTKDSIKNWIVAQTSIGKEKINRSFSFHTFVFKLFALQN